MALDLDALETSFDLVAARGDEVVESFYTRLFATAPGVALLFAETDLNHQKKMLLASLVLVRKSLRDMDDLVPKLRELGARHYSYGARDGHYPLVGETLIASMAEVAGDAWRPRYERAWTEAFALIAAAMLDGAESARVAQAA
jgi:nitric oxide dioxygenase